MINLWLLTYCSYYRDDVEPYIAVDAVTLYVVVDGQTETLQLAVVYCFFRVSIETVASGLDFNEHDFLSIGSYDVDIAPACFPVAFYYLIAIMY